ncbi:hypothetical protein K439DRAFT_83058 [Ramaria rubella]|nr:hypothetical protein K439DRAFT_83058 [Ramaria rubella]
MGYDPDRFDAIDSFWSCHICAHILKEPTLICSSDHVICRDCVPLATMCPWPTCDEKVFDGGFRIDTNMARFLIITCDECDWRGPVSAERDHVTKCEYRRVQCSNENCTEVVLLGSMADHLLQCSAALVPCINSPACTYLGQRSEIAQHRLCCVFFPCRWREAGCDFRGSSVTMGAHELYCTDLHNKLGNLRAAVDRLITENITLRSRGHKVEDCANPGVCPEDVEIVDSNASTGKHQKKRRLRSQVDVDAMPLPELELISTQLDDPIKVKKAKKREKHRGEARLEEEADTLQAIAAEEKRIRREEKAKRRERRKEVRMLAEKAKEICTTAENEQRRPLVSKHHRRLHPTTTFYRRRLP